MKTLFKHLTLGIVLFLLILICLYSFNKPEPLNLQSQTQFYSHSHRNRATFNEAGEIFNLKQKSRPLIVNHLGMQDAKLLPHVVKLSEIVEASPVIPYKLTKVLDHLYIGSVRDATNLELLNEEGITHIINCAELDARTGPDYYDRMKPRNNRKIKYMGFKGEDDLYYNIMKHFDKVYDFIESARNSGGKVLVHCVMGINRSGAMTVAYTMVYKNIGPLTAAKYVQSKRKAMLLTNSAFQIQLIEFASQRGYLEKDLNQIIK